jgi:AraC-like DNA-binding protein
VKHGKSPFTSFYYVWNKASAVFYSACKTPFHSHNTMQLILDTQNNFRFRVKNGQWNTYKSLIIRENVCHQLDTHNSVQLIIYLDAESNGAKDIKSGPLLGKEIYAPDLNIFHLVNSHELEQALVNPEAGRMESLIKIILENLSKEIGIQFSDERILLIEQTISHTHPAEVSIEMLAKKIYLSQSRLRSLFKKVTGTSIHHYMLCNKIRFATNLIMAGNSINEAAVEAGFTDSSHFHKMMVKLFGIAPSDFLKNNKPTQYVICDKDRLVFKTNLA